MPLTLRAFLAVLVLCGACGDDESGGEPGPPDAGVDAAAAPACPTSEAGGAMFPLRLGKAGDGGFVELTDGQEVELVWGIQGFLMVITDVVAEADFGGADEVCFRCEASASSVEDAFPDAAVDYMFHFYRTPDDLYSAQAIIILTDLPSVYHGATALLRARCDGNELTGEVERTINMTVPPP